MVHAVFCQKNAYCLFSVYGDAVVFSVVMQYGIEKL